MVKATKPRLLILGGTAEARELARQIHDAFGDRLDVTSSLAGRTRNAQPIAGQVRQGGFGGVEGLEHYLRDNDISCLIDATHPFAAIITRHAAQAAETLDVPRLVLRRPTWTLPENLKLKRVDNLTEAATTLQELTSQRVFLTTGVQGLDTFATVRDVYFLVRQIENHEALTALQNAQVIVQKPPYNEPGERKLMHEHDIDTLVTKESGGDATVAKLHAAAALGIHVVMISRPVLPPGKAVETVAQALDWLNDQALLGRST